MSSRRFQVVNYLDNEVVHTRIAILKGYITESSMLHTANSRVIVNVRDEYSVNKTRYPVRVTNNGFITVIELFNGKNIIQFKAAEHVDDEFELIFSFDAIESLTSPNFILKPLLVISNHDVDSTKSHNSTLTRIKIGLELIQAFFAEKLYEAGLGRRSFRLGDAQIFGTKASKEDLMNMNTNQVWEMLGREIMADPLVWQEETKYVAFLVHPWKNLLNSSEGHNMHSAVGGGGLALLHSDFVTVWPDSANEILEQIENMSAPDPEPETCKTLLPFHESIGRLYGASLGQVAHELGHIFDLGHTKGGLMGPDFHRFSLCLMPPAFEKIVASRTRNLTIPTRNSSPNSVLLSSGEKVDDVVNIPYSSACILYSNRWFQPAEICRESVALARDANIQFDRNIIKSTFSLSVIEIRDNDTGLVLFSKTFEGNKNSTTASIGRRDIPLSHSNVPVLIFVQDETGFVFKTSLYRNSLPEVFTSVRRREY